MFVEVILYDEEGGPLDAWRSEISSWDFFDSVRFIPKPVNSLKHFEIEVSEHGEGDALTYHLVFLSLDQQSEEEELDWLSENGKEPRTHFFCRGDQDAIPHAAPLPDFTDESGNIVGDLLKGFIERQILKADLLTWHLRNLRERMMEKWKVVASLKSHSPHPLRPYGEDIEIEKGERIALQRKLEDLIAGFDALIHRDEIFNDEEAAKLVAEGAESEESAGEMVDSTDSLEMDFGDFNLSELLDTLGYLTFWKAKLEGKAQGDSLSPDSFLLPTSANLKDADDKPLSILNIVLRGNGTLIDYTFLRLLSAIYHTLGMGDFREDTIGEWLNSGTTVGLALDPDFTTLDSMCQKRNDWEHLSFKSKSHDSSFRYVARRKASDMARLAFWRVPLSEGSEKLQTILTFESTIPESSAV